MKALSIFLTLIYVAFPTYALILIGSGKLPTRGLIFVFLYYAVALALNKKGGKIIKYIAYFTAGILSLFLLGIVLAIYYKIIGQPFDIAIFSISIVFGALGLTTLYCLNKIK